MLLDEDASGGGELLSDSTAAVSLLLAAIALTALPVAKSKDILCQYEETFAKKRSGRRFQAYTESLWAVRVFVSYLST